MTNPVPTARQPPNDRYVAAAFVILVTLTRWPIFHRSVMDWDESLYFLMAGAWRAGHLPYTAIWDNKPVGIYAIFAVFQALFGNQIAAMRLATIAFVSLGAFAVYKITWAINARRALTPAVLAGLLFIVGAMSNDGLSANTELFMASITALAVLTAVVPAKRPPLQAFVTGLLLGAAFMVKYVAMFEAPVIGLLLLSHYPWRKAFLLIPVAISGAALPLLATICLYWQAGQLPLWWSASIASNFRRIAVPVAPHVLSYISAVEASRWGTLYLAAAIMAGLAAWQAWRIAQRRRADRSQIKQIFLVLWLIAGLVGVASAKSFYDHYFLQILPVLCVTSGALLGLVKRGFALTALALLMFSLPAIAAAAALWQAAAPVLSFVQFRPHWHQDEPAQIAADLAPQIAGGSGCKLYVFDDQPISYALTGQTPPTRFVFPSVLTTKALAKVAGVDAPAELSRILALQPRFIIRRIRPNTTPATANAAVYQRLDQTLAAHYRLWRVYQEAEIYQRTN